MNKWMIWGGKSHYFWVDTQLENALLFAPRYVMTPFDSWLRPACMGLFTVEDDRDKVPDIR